MQAKNSKITKAKDGSARGIKHGLGHTPEYTVFQGMHQRCYDKNCDRFQDWGGRGIKICKEWLDDFENFYNDMGERPSSKHQIDRIDNDGDYSKENCRWVTISENSLNKRIYGNNKSGYKGVSYDGRHKTRNWRATIMRNRKQYHVGNFYTPEEANEARLKELQK